MQAELTRENLSHEFQVLLAGLQAHLKTAPEPDWSRLLTPDLDWPQVLRLCQHHEVTPLVYESLSKHADKVPLETLSDFKQQVIKDKRKSLHLAGVLQDLLALFEREAIEVLPYKGVVLSQQLFGDIAKRPTKDLDIAVQRKDYVRARDLLLAHGFVGPLTGFGKLATPQQERLLLQSGHHHVFRGHGVLVELHFEIIPASGHKTFPLSELWHQLASSTYQNHPIKELNSETLLSVLSSHAASHYWRRLKWLFDSAKLLDQTPLSDEVLQKAKTTQREIVLLANVTLCHVLLALPLNESVQASILAHPSLLEIHYHTLRQFQNWPHNEISGFVRLQWRIWLSDSFNIVTLQKMLWFIFIKGGYNFLSIPSFVYALATPFRLTVNYVRQFFRV